MEGRRRIEREMAEREQKCRFMEDPLRPVESTIVDCFVGRC
jgi:hypothetical protein